MEFDTFECTNFLLQEKKEEKEKEKATRKNAVSEHMDTCMCLPVCKVA